MLEKYRDELIVSINNMKKRLEKAKTPLEKRGIEHMINCYSESLRGVEWQIKRRRENDNGKTV